MKESTVKRSYRKLPILSPQGVIGTLEAFVFSFNQANPKRQRQKAITLAYAEILFA